MTVYGDGHGIIINDHNIKVLKSEEFTTFKRRVDVSDGKSSIKFPSVKNMIKTEKQNRFTEYGLWTYSKDNIIKDIVQEDWDGVKSTKKNLKWVFNIDQTKIKNKHIYNLGYVLSVPGMFKFSNGYADMTRKNKKNLPMSSVLEISHRVKEVEFEVAFDADVKLSKVPICKLYNASDSNHSVPINACSTKYNALYTKYRFIIKSPKIGNVIKVEWEALAPPQQNT